MKEVIEISNTYPVMSSPYCAKDFIQWVTDKVQEVPEQHRESASILFHAHGDDDYMYHTLEIRHKRLETDAEEVQRKREESVEEAYQECMEREELARLQAKYNPRSTEEELARLQAKYNPQSKGE